MLLSLEHDSCQVNVTVQRLGSTGQDKAVILRKRVVRCQNSPNSGLEMSAKRLPSADHWQPEFKQGAKKVRSSHNSCFLLRQIRVFFNSERVFAIKD